LSERIIQSTPRLRQHVELVLMEFGGSIHQSINSESELLDLFLLRMLVLGKTFFKFGVKNTLNKANAMAAPPPPAMINPPIVVTTISVS
jgi:hypothetical protein